MVFGCSTSPYLFIAEMRKRVFPLQLVLSVSLLPYASYAAAPTPSGRAEHVVVVVWDGMRPDFVSPQFCPTLYGLATNGTFFRRNHPVYISSTEVNGAAIATG